MKRKQISSNSSSAWLAKQAYPTSASPNHLLIGQNSRAPNKRICSRKPDARQFPRQSRCQNAFNRISPKFIAAVSPSDVLATVTLSEADATRGSPGLLGLDSSPDPRFPCATLMN